MTVCHQYESGCECVQCLIREEYANERYLNDPFESNANGYSDEEADEMFSRILAEQYRIKK